MDGLSNKLKRWRGRFGQSDLLCRTNLRHKATNAQFKADNRSSALEPDEVSHSLKGTNGAASCHRSLLTSSASGIHPHKLREDSRTTTYTEIGKQDRGSSCSLCLAVLARRVLPTAPQNTSADFRHLHIRYFLIEQSEYLVCHMIVHDGLMECAHFESENLTVNLPYIVHVDYAPYDGVHARLRRQPNNSGVPEHVSLNQCAISGQAADLLSLAVTFHDLSIYQCLLDEVSGEYPYCFLVQNLRRLVLWLPLLAQSGSLVTVRGKIIEFHHYSTTQLAKSTRTAWGNALGSNCFEAQISAGGYSYGNSIIEDVSDLIGANTDADGFAPFLRNMIAMQLTAGNYCDKVVGRQELYAMPKLILRAKDVADMTIARYWWMDPLQSWRLCPSRSIQSFLLQYTWTEILALVLCHQVTTMSQQAQTESSTTSTRLYSEAVRASITGFRDQWSAFGRLSNAELIILDLFCPDSFTPEWFYSFLILLTRSTTVMHEVNPSATIDLISRTITTPFAAQYARKQSRRTALVSVRGTGRIAVESDEGTILLCTAVLSGCTDMVHCLLSAGIDVNRKETLTGFTPLHFAVLARSPATVSALIDKGAVACVDHDTMPYRPRIQWVDRVMSALARCELSNRNHRVCSNGTSKASESSQAHCTHKRGTKRSSATTKRGLDQRPQSDEWNTPSDDEDTPKKRKMGQPDPDLVTANQEPFKFACPYLKFDQVKFGYKRGCGDIGYDSIPSLKDHLHKKHRTYRCERCGLSGLANDSQLNAHMTTDRCRWSAKPSRDHSEGFYLSQATEIRRRRRNQDAQTKWTDIYKVLFGLVDSDVLPSPYFETRAQLSYENQWLRDENRRLQETIRQLQQSTAQIPASQVLTSEHRPVPNITEPTYARSDMPSHVPREKSDQTSLYELEPGAMCSEPMDRALEEADSGDQFDLLQYIDEASICPINDDEIWTEQSSADSGNQIWSSGSIISTVPTRSSDEMPDDIAQKRSRVDAPVQYSSDFMTNSMGNIP